MPLVMFLKYFIVLLNVLRVDVRSLEVIGVLGLSRFGFS